MKYNKIEREMRKVMAFELAVRYCQEHGLSVDKLAEQQVHMLDDMIMFATPSGVEPKGLTNDLATMPIPALMLIYEDGKLRFEETEHTKRLLT